MLKTSVKYFTKVTHLSLPAVSIHCPFSILEKSLSSTNQTTCHRSTSKCHSSLAINPLVGTIHHRLHLHRRQHHLLIHLPEFLFFGYPPSSSSSSLFLSHLHCRWFMLLISILVFLFLYYHIALSSWVLDGLWVMGGWVCGGWLGCFVVAGLWVFVGS